MTQSTEPGAINSVERIQAAEEQVAELQANLDTVQAGLARAESVATAAQEARVSYRTILIVGTVVLAIGAVVVIRRRRSER
ncbi:hypothetical protein [Ilumatobacter nonamiensis]|uniref:hypothetical protein n=1 Tax=Ilumatobacter nonamiensis TaxID=467093 RepID=UPI00034ADE6F|nr:hypothetical protein [Ilumatobacter nonamiensis]